MKDTLFLNLFHENHPQQSRRGKNIKPKSNASFLPSTCLLVLQCQSAKSNPLPPSSNYRHSPISQWFQTPRSDPNKSIRDQIKFNEKKNTQYHKSKLERNPDDKITFLGEIWACFFSTWWYNCAASFSQTWHLMYGMSSLLATPTGFFEQWETCSHVEITSIEKTNTIIVFIFIFIIFSLVSRKTGLYQHSNGEVIDTLC